MSNQFKPIIYKDGSDLSTTLKKTADLNNVKTPRIMVLDDNS